MQPDHKIVEDGHTAIRDNTKKTGGRKVPPHLRMQFVLANSKLFGSRRMDHPAAVCKEHFVSALANT